jgi:threonine dehydrogenase-like Zn-dependent dehydrogenase
MTHMTKQVFIHAPYDIRLDEVAPVDRALGPYEMRVKTELTALSPGTETRIYTGTDAERFAYRVRYPFPVGYNNIGRVVEIGSHVQQYRVGQRIFSRMPHISEYIVAERVLSEPPPPLNAPQGVAMANVPSNYDVIAPVPDGVPSEQALFTHLFTLGFNALKRGQFQFGENVLVIGLGVVGLGAVCMARAAGARVAAIGNASSRLEVARAMGADEAWLSGDHDIERAATFAGEAGIDLIIVCTDAWAALQTAIAVSRRSTRIAVLSFPGIGQGAAPFDAFEPADFYNRSLSYIAVSWMPTDDYPPEYQRFTVKRIYRYILDLLARQRIDLSPIVTHRLPIAQIKDGFDLVVSKDKSVLGVVFEW